MWKSKPGEKRLEDRRRGPRGPRGPAGPTGPEGPRGKTGQKGQAAKLDSLQALDAHVAKIDQELKIQRQRIAQLQMELDEARAAIKRLAALQQRREVPPPQPVRTDS